MLRAAATSLLPQEHPWKRDPTPPTLQPQEWDIRGRAAHRPYRPKAPGPPGHGVRGGAGAKDHGAWVWILGATGDAWAQRGGGGHAGVPGGLGQGRVQLPGGP
ncbi:hypothetical protein NDU88_005763 [Pleurodeles waltl]|uniref:Uncharacterized protein n=1 Tax=Pleurodeles waltl TaxID=8319 RepID=A0AAV7LAC0_PLEWA|nr:hypothetical protein NDU88_005763 [Pleurodeles waltl]